MPDLGILKTINLRVQWEHEDDDFTPWLSKNLALLNKVLNMNLEKVDDHVKVGRYECDLLCRNRKDRSYVVIENQLADFDHDHLGKALVYAAGLDARTVIWIAEHFTNEHRNTLNWLNENTRDRLQFFGVQLEVVQVENSPYAPKFNIISTPNNWMRPFIISDDYWRDFAHYLEQQGSSLKVLRWHGGPNRLGFYLGYGDNNGQHPDYWISAGKSGGFIAANFCINKQNLPNIEQWFANNKQGIDRKFDAEFEAEPKRPSHPYVEVGVAEISNSETEYTYEKELLMKHQNKSLWQPLLIISLIVLIFCTISTLPAQTAPEISEKALAATVYLEMQDSNGLPLGLGSGFFVRDNLIATNYHVIEGAARGRAKLVGQFSTYTIEGVTATDKTNDLALLKVTVYGINPLPLGNSSDVKIGETVYVAGNPKGLEGTFSDGIISSHRDPYTKKHLQMTAPVSPGSSGGPVLNSKGEVIGVSFMTLVGGQNLNSAIPSRYLTELLTESTPAKPLAEGNRSISAKTYFTWGNTKAGLGDYKGAIADFDNAIRLKPDHANTYNNRGIAKDNLGQHSAAIADFDSAIRLKPDHANAYLYRGVAKSKLGQHSAAIADFDNAIRLKPDHASAYFNRGFVKGLLNRISEAKRDARTALRLAKQVGDTDLITHIEKLLRRLEGY